MKRQLIVGALFVATFPSSLYSQTLESLLELKPLLTVRSDVRRLLGKSTDERPDSDLFVSKEFKVSVLYSAGRCTGRRPRWNVDIDVVVSLLVMPMRDQSLDKSIIQREGLVGSVQDDLSVEYKNESAGKKYTVSQFDTVTSILLSPDKESAKKKACRN